MKRFTFVLALVTLMAGGIALARVIAYDEKKPPRLPLPDAYHLAMQALGTDTNKFHCISAGTLISRSPDGEWLFTFCDTAGAKKNVFVFFDKQTRVGDGSPRF
jgi:hypothetical protein